MNSIAPSKKPEDEDFDMLESDPEDVQEEEEVEVIKSNTLR
jgi:hypothetical protein